MTLTEKLNNEINQNNLLEKIVIGCAAVFAIGYLIRAIKS